MTRTWKKKNKKSKNGQDTALAKAWTNWTSSLSIIQQRMNVNFSSPHSNLFLCVLFLKEMRTAAKNFLVIPFHIISLGRNSVLTYLKRVKEWETRKKKKLEKVYEFFSGKFFAWILCNLPHTSLRQVYSFRCKNILQILLLRQLWAFFRRKV